MINGMMVKDMVAVVERERMVNFARHRPIEGLAQGGRSDGPVERAKKMIGALLKRMGRPLGRGSAPASDGTNRLNHANADSARFSNQSMSIARF